MLERRNLSVPLIVLCLTVLFLGVSRRYIATRAVLGESTIAGTPIALFFDSACTQPVASIRWGTLYPGRASTVKLYFKNVGDYGVILLSVQGGNYVPANSSRYLYLALDYGGSIIHPKDAAPVSFSLQVAQRIQGIESFSFDMSIYSIPSSTLDLNNDQMIDIVDLAMIANHFMIPYNSSLWDSRFDINSDKTVNIIDIVLVVNHYHAVP